MSATVNVKPNLGTEVHSSALAEATVIALLLATDTVAVGGSFAIAHLVREHLFRRLDFVSMRGESIDLHAYFAFIPVFLLVFALAGLYSRRTSSIEEGVRSVRACFYAAGCVLVFASIAHVSQYFSRIVIFGAFCLLTALVPTLRFALKSRAGAWRPWQRPIVLLNFHPGAERAAQDLVSDPTTGYRIAAVTDAIEWCRESGYRSFLLCGDPATVERQVQLLDEFADEIWIAGAEYTWRLESEVLRSSFLLKHENPLANPANRAAKRALDIAAGAAIAIAFLPAILLIPLWIRLREGGPVLYAHERQGAGGRRFQCWKFRTMRRDADEQLRKLLASDPAIAAEFHATYKLRQDPRITASGQWLRRTSLDELPQLWNVLAGDMSLVGPRPRLLEEQHAAGLLAPVGLTGLWQISGRSDLSYEERNRLDLFYVRNWSIWLDLVILARTVPYFVRPKGAY